MSDPTQALTLKWVFGLSHHVGGGVVNLSDSKRSRVLYPAAHTAVIYDLRNRSQTVLQGHTAAISCVCATVDRTVVATADAGPDALVVLWSTETARPLHVINRPHEHGVCAMALSPDVSFLVTLSKADPDTDEQEIALWDLLGKAGSPDQAAGEGPSRVAAVPVGDEQTAVCFNPADLTELLTTGRRRVYFWAAPETSATLKFYSPPLRASDFRQIIGAFTTSVFVPGTTQALTGTDDGDVVVWEEQGLMAQTGTRSTDRRAAKVMRLHNSRITHLSTCGDYVVTGGADGFVRFFDPVLRLMAWFDDIAAGEVTSVSFSLEPVEIQEAADPSAMDAFVAPNFMVGTTHAKVLAVRAASFNESCSKAEAAQLVVEGMLPKIACIAAHPVKPQFAVLGADGRLQIWEILRHTLVGSHREPVQGTAMKFSRDGELLLLAFENGSMKILRSDTFAEVTASKNSKAEITHAAFAATGAHAALADATQMVLLYSCVNYKDKLWRWEYIGRHKSHHAPIVALKFGEAPSGKTRLFSIGQDCRMVEYALEGSSVTTGLQVVGFSTICSGACPTAFSFTPPRAYFEQGLMETRLVLADSNFKLRIYDPDGRVNQRTCIGPSHGGPVNDLHIFQSVASGGSFLAFSTQERVVGIIAWPIDGDPHRSMGIIANPGRLSGLVVSFDGRKLMAAGEDGTVSVWDIHTPALERAVIEANKDAKKWEKLLEDDALLQEVKDYFCYAQIRAQGEDCTEPRSVRGLIPIQMVPDLTCALGFYPTQADMNDMMTDLRHQASEKQKAMPSHISLETFLRLYINYRPVKGVTKAEILQAFKTLGAPPRTLAIGREALLAALMGEGEALGLEEVQEAFQLLTGSANLDQSLKPQVTAHEFLEDVLGFESNE